VSIDTVSVVSFLFSVVSFLCIVHTVFQSICLIRFETCDMIYTNTSVFI